MSESAGFNVSTDHFRGKIFRFWAIDWTGTKNQTHNRQKTRNIQTLTQTNCPKFRKTQNLKPTPIAICDNSR